MDIKINIKKNRNIIMEYNYPSFETIRLSLIHLIMPFLF